MQLHELYKKSIARPVNPAVSATKFDEETIKTEIGEYVFTDEIMNGLYRILDAIKDNRRFDHVGIWIDGYYGSGKSHFLKYLDYCITPSTREDALKRFIEAVGEIDPMDDSHDLQFEASDLISIANWLKNATIDTCIFNLETSHDSTADKRQAFLQVFWNEFNGKRGLNKFNIALAQLLEKPMMELGVFDEFKRRIAEEGGNWDNPSKAADYVDQSLDWVVDIATEVNPRFDSNSLYNSLDSRKYSISIERFGMELASYLQTKDDNYRLILLADEVSQFINKERDRYLNLQEIITKLSEACDNKVWVACTAQQDLSEVLDDCNIGDEKDKEGKIKGRFEVKVSLKGTQTEVITQKRILDKKDEVKETLGAIYDKQKADYGLRFKLPTGYNSYDSREDFIDYYPFVPYQFKLIMQVFNSFLNLGYVAKEVKGNERSLIKVVHSTAKNNADAPLGKFVSFDELYNNMFEEGLQARGQKAVDNALRIAETYPDKKLAKRVANVLFMVCNISQNDQLLFPATSDNITTLLVGDYETPRLNIKNAIEKVLEFFCDKNIIRREQGKNGGPEYFSFYSEEEMKVAELIKNQVVDNTMMAEQLKSIFNKHLMSLRNKERYKTRDFAVQMLIKQRTFFSNSPDVVVEFAMDMDYNTADDLALQNVPNKLVYFLAPQFMANSKLRNNFFWWCKVNSYMATPPTSEENAQTRKEFEKRAQSIYETVIEKEFQKILDTCPIVSGMTVIDDLELNGKRGNDRYMFAIQKHLASIYTKAGLVDNAQFPHNTTDLKAAILRNVNPGDYDGFNAELTAAENEVEIYLTKQFTEVNVADVLAKFAKAPYGWDNICTLFVVNELVRRHRRDYSYGNNPNVDTSVVAGRIVSETNKFTLRAAEAISQDVVNQFVDAWKAIFGVTNTFSTTDSTQIFRLSREKDSARGLENFRDRYKEIARKYARYSFITPINEAVDLIEAWLMVRDPLKFFNRVIADKAKAAQLFDSCKEVVQFTHDQMNNYQSIIDFVRDNSDNFHYVSADLQPTVQQIQMIETAAWPINIREYIKLRNVINSAIDELRRDLRAQITEAYNSTYEQLERGCQEEGVPVSVLSDRQAVITTRTQTLSIPVLQNNLDTNQFFAEQSARILAAKPKAKEPTSGTPATPATPTAKTVTMDLHTRTIAPLKTEAEVDKYLANLKKQMMDEINKGNSVRIIK